MASNNKPLFWNDELMRKLLNMLIAYRRKFGKEQPFSWIELAIQFEEATGKKCGKDALRNKHRQMKNWWMQWKDLKHRETWLSWDAERGCINATNELWDMKIGENVYFKQFRMKGISPDLEDLLDQVYGRMPGEFQLGDGHQLGSEYDHLGPNFDDDTPFGMRTL